MLKINAQIHRSDFSLYVAFEQTARVTGVFGPSGAGKSTLMHLIAGLEAPESGRIELDGQVLFDSRSGVNLPAHRRRIGVMFQDDRLFPHYSVHGNLRYGERSDASESNRAAPVLSFDAVVALLNLRDLLPRRIATLSGGERQRVALGRALLSNPKLLLLDEPLSSLDAGLKRQILPYLRKVRDAAGIPMLYVSHDLTEMLQITDQLLLLERGRVISHGRFGDLAHEHDAIEALHSHGLVNVIAATLIGRDEAAGVVDLTIGNAAPGEASARLRAAIGTDAAIGSSIEITIRASDIALAIGRVDGVSIQNQLPGKVKRITQHAGRAVVEVDIGGASLLAEVTPKAVESLRIEPGRAMWCLIKSNAVRRAT